MGTLFKFADFLHDAEREVENNLTGYRLSSTEFAEATLAAARVVEAARDVVWVKDEAGNLSSVHGFDRFEAAVRRFA